MLQHIQENTVIYNEAIIARIYDKDELKVYEVWLCYDDQYGPFGYCAVVRDVIVDELPLISEETTPFTAKVIEKLSNVPIRDTWAGNIRNFIIEIGKAEIQGELESKLHEIVKTIKAGAWVYEYAYLLKIIEATAKEFGVKI